MFKLQKNRIVKNWPCTIDIALDGGKTAALKCTLDFKLLSVAEQDKLAGKSDAEYLAAVVTGWDGIGDEDGNPVPFSPESLADACQQTEFCIGAVAAHKEAYSGAAIKNLRARQRIGLTDRAKPTETN